MKLSLIINALKQRVPEFQGRVAGAAEFDNLPEIGNLTLPAAWVIPMSAEPGEPMSANDTRQALVEVFGVVVALSNTPDERGQAAAYDAVDTMQAALWRALLGWRPTLDHNGIYYEGGALLGRDRSRLWWRYEFAAYSEISPSDGWQGVELAALLDLETVEISVDDIDPAADANLQYPGPDGRIEHAVTIDLTE
jgi:hypothetical protein